jgi:hypothetical protein
MCDSLYLDYFANANNWSHLANIVKQLKMQGFCSLKLLDSFTNVVASRVVIVLFSVSMVAPIFFVLHTP